MDLVGDTWLYIALANFQERLRARRGTFTIPLKYDGPLGFKSMFLKNSFFVKCICIGRAIQYNKDWVQRTLIQMLDGMEDNEKTHGFEKLRMLDGMEDNARAETGEPEDDVVVETGES